MFLVDPTETRWDDAGNAMASATSAYDVEPFRETPISEALPWVVLSWLAFAGAVAMSVAGMLM